jgi:hypothetical protein
MRVYASLLNFSVVYNPPEAGGGAYGRGIALQAGTSRFQFPMVSLEIFIDIILPAALWPGSGTKRRPVRTADNVPPTWADCLEIWEPQAPGTLRACAGFALPFI